MRDPWHEETLAELVTYLAAPRRGRRAVVVTSGPELEAEVVAGLRARLGGERPVAVVEVGEAQDHVEVLSAAARGPERPGLVTLVLGLPGLAARQRAEAPGELPAVLGYLNLNRELFDRAGEGFVFLLDGETAEEVTAGAGDFARYARWCELTAWDDLLRAGAADVDGTRLEQESWEREEREARDRVERIRKAGGEVATLAEALCDHACALLNLLRAGEALTRCDEAVELTRGADAPSTESRALAGRAAVLCDLLRICEAQQDARRALALARARGRSHLTASADNVLSVSLFLSGQVADALRHAEAAAEAMARIGAAADAAVNLGNAAQDRLLLGDLPGASTTAAAALASAREATAPREEGMALHRVGEVELARGGLAQAAAALGRSLALLGGLRDVPSRVRTLRFLADLRLATGHPTVALETVKGALEQVRRGMSPWGESLLAPTAAAVHLALGAPAAARALVEPASAAARSAGLRLVEAHEIDVDQGLEQSGRVALRDAHGQELPLGAGGVRRKRGRPFGGCEGGFEESRGENDQGAVTLDRRLHVQNEVGARAEIPSLDPYRTASLLQFPRNPLRPALIRAGVAYEIARHVEAPCAVIAISVPSFVRRRPPASPRQDRQMLHDVHGRVKSRDIPARRSELWPIRLRRTEGG